MFSVKSATSITKRELPTRDLIDASLHIKYTLQIVTDYSLLVRIILFKKNHCSKHVIEALHPSSLFEGRIAWTTNKINAFPPNR